MAYLRGGNTHHRERGRKPLSQARFNAKRGEKQGFLPTIAVERDPRFLPQICLLIHGVVFFGRLLREPQHLRTAMPGRITRAAERPTFTDGTEPDNHIPSLPSSFKHRTSRTFFGGT